MSGRVSSGTSAIFNDFKLRMIRAYRTKDTFLNQTATHYLAILGLLADSFLQALSVHLPVPPADPLNGMIDRRSPKAATHLLGGDG